MRQLKQAHQGVVGGRNLCLLFLGESMILLYNMGVVYKSTLL
jgi:hypothetical protein